MIYPPRTLMEVYDMLPEGTLAELIDNQIYMSPAPIFFHQDVLAEIAFQLRILLKEAGKVVLAPFDVKLDETRNAVQPDIVVILNNNPNQINKEGKFFGVPDLLVEILSPGNKDYDLITKKDLYERFGVKEYWVVDPQTKLAMVFWLDEGRYQKISDEVGQIKSTLLNTDFNF